MLIIRPNIPFENRWGTFKTNVFLYLKGCRKDGTMHQLFDTLKK